MVEHPHSAFRSISAVSISHGTRLKELQGATSTATSTPAASGACGSDGKKPTWHQELAVTQLRIVAFGEDNGGEIYLVDFMGGQLHRLVPAPKPTVTHDFPAQAERDRPLRLHEDHRPAGADPVLGQRAALVRWTDQGALPRAAGPIADRVRDGDLPQPAPGGGRLGASRMGRCW